jgi:hypothetical protein
LARFLKQAWSRPRFEFPQLAKRGQLPVSVPWKAQNGSEAERRYAFADTHRMLYQRIGIFVNLPIASLDRLALQKKLDDIGRSSIALESEKG